MTKSNRRESFIVAFSSRGLESIVAGTVWHGTGTGCWLHHMTSAHRKRDSRKWAPMTCFFQQCAFSYRVHSFPNSTTDWGPSIQMREPMSTFVIQISRVLPRDQGQGIMKGHTPALEMGSSSVFLGWFFLSLPFPALTLRDFIHLFSIWWRGSSMLLFWWLGCGLFPMGWLMKLMFYICVIQIDWR